MPFKGFFEQNGINGAGGVRKHDNDFVAFAVGLDRMHDELSQSRNRVNGLQSGFEKRQRFGVGPRATNK